MVNGVLNHVIRGTVKRVGYLSPGENSQETSWLSNNLKALFFIPGKETSMQNRKECQANIFHFNM